MPINGSKFDEKGMVAFVTGGSSGIAKEFSRILHEAGAKVVVADVSEDAGKAFVAELNSDGQERALFAKVNVANWDEQKAAIKLTLEKFGRIDYVAPIAGIGERKHLPSRTDGDFEKPDLTTLDIDLTGFIYSCSLAIQAFRRQEPNRYGFRGKIIGLASVCGFYNVPTTPIYTSAKHGVVGYVKSFGQHLVTEGITLNAVCPHVLRTNISSETFYDKMEKEANLVPMDKVQEALTRFLGQNKDSAQTLEVSPTGKIVPWNGKPNLDKETELSCQMIHQRSIALHQLEN